MQSVVHVTKQHFDLFLVFVSVRQCGRRSTCQHWWQKISPTYLNVFSGKLFSSCQATTTVWAAWQTGEQLHLNMATGHRQADFRFPPCYWACPLLSFTFRILSDWLEVKFGGGKALESSVEQVDGALKTLCVTNTFQEKKERIHRVHISIKVRSDCSLYVWLWSNTQKTCERCIVCNTSAPKIHKQQECLRNCSDVN